MPRPLEIHIFGGSIGESIVIGLPYGGWGVVDNYTPNLDDPDSSATVRFLRERKITELEFLCLTHPHDDHVKGVNYLVQNFNFKRFWSFGAFTHRQLFALVEKTLRVKEALRNDSQEERELTDDLVAALDTACQRARAGTTELRRCDLGLVMYQYQPTQLEPMVKITALGPSGRSSAIYEKTLHACFDKTASHEILAEKIKGVNHNQISSGLLVEYGKTRVVLGGDIEQDGWQDVINHDSPRLDLRSHLIKVSHHGSTTGYCVRLWEDHFSPVQSAVATITPFSRKGLPRPEGISHIKTNCRQVFTASKSSIKNQQPPLFPAAFQFGQMSADVVVALQTVFSAARKKSILTQGACSFSFDENGNLSTSMSGDAGVL